MLIRVGQRYFDENNNQIDELMLVDCDTLQPVSTEEASKLGEPISLFFGTAHVPVIGIDEHGHQVQMPPQQITFPIEVLSRREAFEQFANAANKYLNLIRAESEKSKIIVPSAADVNNISSKLKLST